MRMGRRSPMEILVMVIFTAILLQVAVGLIAPLVPYMLGVIGLIGVGYVGKEIYQRNRNW